MPQYHFRVESTYRGPSLIVASSWQDLLDKVKLWTAHTMPANLTIEFLRDISDELEEKEISHAS